MAKKAAARKRPTRKQQEERRQVPKHRQCPTCYAGALNGVGNRYSGHGSKAYYKCDRCGNTWSVTTQHHREVIEHREVEIDTRDQ